MFIRFLKELKQRWIEFFLGALIIALVISVFVVQRSIAKSSQDEIKKLSHKLGNNILLVPNGHDDPP